MAQKISTLSLTGSGSVATMERGRLDPGKGKKVQGIRLKVTCPVANTTGGDAALSDANRQLLLALLRVDHLAYGKNGRFKPFAAVDFARIHREQRRAYMSEMEGYSDTSTGLAKTITNTQTANLVFYPVIPTGKNARWPGMLGMGRSQSRTVELKLRQLGTAIASGWAINGNVTVEIIPDAISCKGDPWCVVPAYIEESEVDKTHTFPEGLPLAITERTAVHASTSLTDVSVKVDEEYIHDKVSPAELLTELNDSALLPSTGLLTDRETILLDYPFEQRFRDLPSGVAKVTQNVKNLATMSLSMLYIPLVSEEEIAAEIEDLAANVRKKTVKLVSRAAVEGDAMPDRLKPYAGYVLVDADDREFDAIAGVAAAPGGKAQVHVPELLAERARTVAAAHEAKGEKKAAEAVIRSIAGSVPAAVQSGRGFAPGSGILEAVRRKIAGK